MKRLSFKDPKFFAAVIGSSAVVFWLEIRGVLVPEFVSNLASDAFFAMLVLLLS